MIEEMPPELRELVSAERAAPIATDAARVAIRAKVGKSLGLAAPAGAAVKSGLAIKLLTIVGIAVVGTSAALLASRDPIRAVAAPQAPGPTLDFEVARLERSVESPEQRLEAERVEVERVEVERLEIAKNAPPQVRPRHRPRSSRAAAPASFTPAPVRTQRELLAEASRSLARDPARTLAIVEEDARLHRAGVLAEERDALRVNALLALGRRSEARAAALDMLRTYPNTIHEQLLARALEKTP